MKKPKYQTSLSLTQEEKDILDTLEDSIIDIFRCGLEQKRREKEYADKRQNET